MLNFMGPGLVKGVVTADNGRSYNVEIDADGGASTVAGSGEAGFADGVGAAAQFDYPARGQPLNPRRLDLALH